MQQKRSSSSVASGSSSITTLFGSPPPLLKEVAHRKAYAIDTTWRCEVYCTAASSTSTMTLMLQPF
jgi:hypothetical protein